MKERKPSCPVAEAVKVLSDAWTMLIVHNLLGGPKRFCELERLLGGISTRTLTLKLKKLVAGGMAVKGKDGRYAVTARGKGLKIVENAMRRYQEQYL